MNRYFPIPIHWYFDPSIYEFEKKYIFNQSPEKEATSEWQGLCLHFIIFFHKKPAKERVRNLTFLVL